MINEFHLIKKLKLDNHIITNWFKIKGWSYYKHQLQTFDKIKNHKDVLLISPTGSGKTLAGFLPSLCDLIPNKDTNYLHTLYISPLKSLTYDIEKNLLEPIKELKLDISVESRTGDTNYSKKKNQLLVPPQILATTIESFVLLMSHPNYKDFFKNLKFLIIDEVHTVTNTKRGELLSLNLARLSGFNQKFQKILLSATAPNNKDIINYFSSKNGQIICSKIKKKKEIMIIKSQKRIPWSGHMAEYAVAEIYNTVAKKKKSIIFVNTRAQAELLFHNLWKINKDNLKIALHHGSLEKKLRMKVEDSMAKNEIDCIVSTSSLELGLDWSNIDLIINVGSPKGVTRLIQRIGRGNHCLKKKSKAFLVPTNRLEFIECNAAIEAINENDLDFLPNREGSLDVLAQHILGVACSSSINSDNLYKNIIESWPYRNLKKSSFLSVLRFVKDGGYTLKRYKQFSKLKKNKNGDYQISSKNFITQYRMNIGTIVESQMLKVKLKNKTLGNIEEWFIQKLKNGDTFIFGGEVLSFESLKYDIVNVKKSKNKSPRIPSYAGGKMPLTSKLSQRVISIINDKEKWNNLPTDVIRWLDLQKKKSLLPPKDKLLIESFPRSKGNINEFYYIFYTFEGKNVNDTLGFVLSKFFQSKGYQPLGFVTTDYALALWVNKKILLLEKIFDQDEIKKSLNEWLYESSLFKRNFRKVATISGLIDRGFPNKRKKISFNSDLIFEVLMKYEKDHILIKAAKDESKRDLVEIDRLYLYLDRIKDKIIYKNLNKISPFSVPLMIEINKEFLNKKLIDEYYLNQLENEVLKEVGLN
ncbi:MAG: DNA ligase-associated DEXH box helicase [Rickettsiales bacterium]|nr:DNA ligase-associated DEXH box helicase [Rickettsiales bacterium]